VVLVARHRIPAIYDRREFAEAEGLISYGASVPAGYRKGGSYTVRILKGPSQPDLPMEQAATFELGINLRAVKALGLTCAAIVARPRRRADRIGRDFRSRHL
jgi:putative tryptophan/tyrosine transport system substrate-binding protein